MMRLCGAAVTLIYKAANLYTLVVYCINQFVRSGVPRVPRRTAIFLSADSPLLRLVFTRQRSLRKLILTLHITSI